MFHRSRFICVFLLLALSALLAGCTVTPSPVYRAHPVEGSGIWNNGVELVELQENDLEVVVAGEGFQRRNLVFLVEVLNSSDTPVTVDPAAFFLETTPPGYARVAIPAIDPEKRLLQTDLSRSRAVARRQSREKTRTCSFP